MDQQVDSLRTFVLLLVANDYCTEPVPWTEHKRRESFVTAGHFPVLTLYWTGRE